MTALTAVQASRCKLSPVSTSSSTTTTPTTTPISSITSVAGSSTTTSITTETTSSSSSTTTSSISTYVDSSSATNVVQNGGFEDQVLNPWILTTSSWSGSVVKYSSAYEGSYVFGGSTPSASGPGTVSLSQTIQIPDGTYVSCTGEAWSSRYPNSDPFYTTTFSISIDGQLCGSVGIGSGSTSWMQFGGPVTVSGDTHTLEVLVSSPGTYLVGTAYYVDAINVQALNICPSDA